MLERTKYYAWHQWVACIAIATIDVVAGLFRLATLGLLRFTHAGTLSLYIMDWSLTKTALEGRSLPRLLEEL